MISDQVDSQLTVEKHDSHTGALAGVPPSE